MRKILRKCKGNACRAFMRVRHSKYFNYLPTPKINTLDYLLFFVYLAFFSFFLPRIPFVKKTGLSTRTLTLLFVLKVAAGLAIGWLSLHYYNAGNDYWDVNREGWKEYQLLLYDPGEYFSNIFRSDYAHGYTGMFDSFQSFWNDLRNNLLIKMVSVFNIFSGGNYYINSVFFNFFVFFGHVALYRIFARLFPGRRLLVLACCFLLPSTLYFTSGIQKDGIVFLMLALFTYAVFFSLAKMKFNLARLAVIGFTLGALFLLRNFVCIALLPAAIAWVLCVKMKWRVLPVFLLVYLITGLLFFNLNSVFPAFNPLETIVKKQSDYLQLPPSVTAIPLDTLRPHFSSFVKNMPQSFNHLLLRPYLAETPSRLLIPLNIELFLYQLLFIAFLFFRRRPGPGDAVPFLAFALFFILTVFLFIGYIVPNLGSLVRYRSLYLPFLVTPLACLIDWGRIGRGSKIIK